eukprot:CAMPEP_0182441334 /NCGR_PEP_ID=MMETSP1172-20130603/269_1 /TAXON_ID=708627 /ORGANISM="Timspurckia oligopyrenoides, Strain CCMP3278" /LENGTH=57 /DNA_ID=CAMNT_0024635533 /DNA_START=28 /DNA_END=201 /DNA_ORIENTATION=+
MIPKNQFDCDFEGCRGQAYGPGTEDDGSCGRKQYCESHFEPKKHKQTNNTELESGVK